MGDISALADLTLRDLLKVVCVAKNRVRPTNISRGSRTTMSRHIIRAAIAERYCCLLPFSISFVFCFVLRWVGAACYGLSLMEAGVSFFDCPVSLIAKVGPQKRARAAISAGSFEASNRLQINYRRAERC
jgi:hypothetical protein